jgi:hypothetical protein
MAGQQQGGKTSEFRLMADDQHGAAAVGPATGAQDAGDVVAGPRAGTISKSLVKALAV